MAQLRLIGQLLRSLPFLILLGGIAGFWFLGQLREPAETRAINTSDPAVETVEVFRGPDVLKLSAQGEVVPFRHVALMAEVSGRVAEKSESCRAGNFVEAGTVLVKIDAEDYRLDVESIQQSIARTDVLIEENDVEQENEEGLLELAEEDVQLQRREVERLMRLNEERVASESQLEAARRTLLQAQTSQQTSRNRIRLLKTRRTGLLRQKDQLLVDLKKAMRNLERTTITAPIDGVIVQDLVEEDDFVQAGSMLVRLEDTARLEVLFDLKLQQLRWIWASKKSDDDRSKPTKSVDKRSSSFTLPSLPVEIRLDLANLSYVWQGRLARYKGAGLDSATRTVPCIAVVEDPKDVKLIEDGTEVSAIGDISRPPVLLRGMFVQLEIAVPIEQPLLQVPAEAIRPGDRVWVFNDGHLDMRQVRTVQRSQEAVLLLPEASDLRPGNLIVVSPLAAAVDGMAIRPVAEPTPDAWPAKPVSHRDNSPDAEEIAR